jgi:hypothetical protein
LMHLFGHHHHSGHGSETGRSTERVDPSI